MLTALVSIGLSKERPPSGIPYHVANDCLRLKGLPVLGLDVQPAAEGGEFFNNGLVEVRDELSMKYLRECATIYTMGRVGLDKEPAAENHLDIVVCGL
mmetsp:Transcript_4206/g.5978  ORF Transcript_4206/g.5978 Transcript_4206/m.5978 type:complete len:98 (-) Transcript_4206:357-650(-)